MIVPDDRCTPGAYENLSKAQVCVHKVRPRVTSRLRKSIKSAYGVAGTWTGEIDHRVPFFLGGYTTALNLWPEAGKIPNPKDGLERYVYERVCHRKPAAMRLSTARGIFLKDWRTAYQRYRIAGQ